MDSRKSLSIEKFLSGYNSCTVAFSGGVDSALLVYLCSEHIGGRVVAVTVKAPWVPEHDLRDADEFCAEYNIEHRVVSFGINDIKGFKENPADRCYICKKALFKEIRRVSEDAGAEAVFEGSNTDDLSDYRPGKKALKELGAVSPFVEAGLSKQDIRELSADLGLDTYNKPSSACIASRVPYGDVLTVEKLERVQKAETALHNMGFTVLRVRDHRGCARVELGPAEIDKGWEQRLGIREALMACGFTQVSIDTRGYV
ncbi:MAG: ATP-dependent sacrificial sulfur transferase LarE, partial [Chitinivibrionales bacterium]